MVIIYSFVKIYWNINENNNFFTKNIYFYSLHIKLKY